MDVILDNIKFVKSQNRTTTAIFHWCLFKIYRQLTSNIESRKQRQQGKVQLGPSPGGPQAPLAIETNILSPFTLTIHTDNVFCLSKNFGLSN